MVANTMTDFYRINTLDELFKALDLPSPKHPLISIVDFRKTPITIALPNVKVVCGFYQIGFKGGGPGSIKYGRERYDYQDGSMMYIAPNQVLEYGDIDYKDYDQNWMLVISPELLQSSSLASKMDDYDFFEYQANEALHVSEKEKGIIESIVEKIQLELDSNMDDFSEEVIISNVELLLNYSKRFYNRQFITRKRFSNDVVDKFEVVLKDYFQQGLQTQQGIPTAAYMADKLCYSPNYLNGLMKKATDKSVLELIHAKVIELAKVELLNSEKNVSEIAFALGFEYSQYFSRLFKKKTGMTPNEFRSAA